MSAARLLPLLVAGLAAAFAGAADAGAATPPRPTGLKAFLLTPNEPAARTFPRTPSFAWKPVRGAVRYEFQLATSRRFNEGAVIWSNVDPKTELAPGTAEPEATTAPATPGLPTTLRTLRSPALALDIALPWITGEPYGLYARVRAVLRNGATPWSNPFGFNVRWRSVAAPQPSVPGLLRWSLVEGATAYEVWIFGAKRVFLTTTNVADQRDLWTFHQSPAWTSAVRWRVRAQRTIYGKIPNGLPAVSYGPWSPIYTSYNPPFAVGAPFSLSTVLSEARSVPGAPTAHQLTPGYAWAGTRGGASGWNVSSELYRVYVSTDRDCVNTVFRGAVVGSPAYAPRVTGPLALPHSEGDVTKAMNETLDHGSEGEALMLDGGLARSSEEASSDDSSSGAKVDLWDTAWPTGGYYWTVVPVVLEQKTEGGFIYRDAELPQDACQSGRVMRFGKVSAPVVTAGRAPYASGMSPRGLLASAGSTFPSFYGAPLVAWKPALGAAEYEVQWSRSAYPWRRAGSITTPATSALLPLTPGTWYYRVRGLNYSLPTKPQMGWSAPVKIRSTKPVFAVAG